MADQKQSELPLVDQANIDNILLSGYDSTVGVEDDRSATVQQIRDSISALTFTPVVNRGDYDAGSTYTTGDAVRYTVPLGARGTDIKILDVPNNTDPTDTSTWVRSGEDGAPAGIPYTFNADTDLDNTAAGEVRIDTGINTLALNNMARVLDNVDYTNWLNAIGPASCLVMHDGITRNRIGVYKVLDSYVPDIVAGPGGTSIYKVPYDVAESVLPGNPPGTGFPGTGDDVAINLIPGGEAGPPGISVTSTSAPYTQPAIGANVQITVATTALFVPLSTCYVTIGGYYRVISVDSATLMTIQNLDVVGNAGQGTVIASPQQVAIAGREGADGIDGIDGIDGTNGDPGPTAGQLYNVVGTAADADGEINFNGFGVTISTNDANVPTNDITGWLDSIGIGSYLQITNEADPADFVNLFLGNGLADQGGGVYAGIAVAQGGAMPAVGEAVRVSAERKGDPGAGGALSVTDDTTTVNDVTLLRFTNGVVTTPAAGEADVETFGSGGSGGGLATRKTYSETSASIADGASAVVDVDAVRAGTIGYAETDIPALVRLYSSEADRTADLGRDATTKATEATRGLIAEFETETGNLSGELSDQPAFTIANDVDILYAHIFNLSGATGTVTLDLEIYPNQGPGQSRIIDSFEAPDSTAIPGRDTEEGAQTWQEGLYLTSTTPVSPAADIQSNTARCLGDNNLVFVDAEAPDVILDLKWTPTTAGSPDNRSLVTIRRQSDGNQFVLILRENGLHELGIVEADTFTQLDTENLTITLDHDYLITVTCTGLAIRVNIKSLSLANHSADLAASSTKFKDATLFGFGREVGSSSTEIDNFSVVPLGKAGSGSGATSTSGRVQITALRTFYVRVADGLRTTFTDELDATTNTPADAFGSWDTAIQQIIGNSDFRGFNPTILSGDTVAQTENLAGTIFLPQLIGATACTLDFGGFVTLDLQNPPNFDQLIQNSSGNNYFVNNVTLVATNPAGECRGLFANLKGSQIDADGVTFGAGINAPFYAFNGSNLRYGNITLNGPNYNFLVATDRSSNVLVDANVTINGSPNFAIALYQQLPQSSIAHFGSASITATGSPTGLQYTLANAALEMAGVTFPPSLTAGTLDPTSYFSP